MSKLATVMSGPTVWVGRQASVIKMDDDFVFLDFTITDDTRGDYRVSLKMPKGMCKLEEESPKA